MTAIWTAPRTWVTGEIVTAAQMNTHLRDNLEYLKAQDDAGMLYRGAGTAAQPSTTSGSFVDVDSSLVLSFTTVGAAFLIGFAGVWKVTTGGADCCMDVEIDGSRIGHSTQGVTFMTAPSANYALPVSWQQIRTLSAGAHTLKLQWRVTAGTLSFNMTGNSHFYAIELR